MIAKIIGFVSDNWQFFTERKPKSLSFIHISTSHGKRFSKGRISILLFKDSAKVPFLVAKFCRDKSYEDSLAKEYKTLNEISSLGIAPQPKAKTRINEKLVIFEEFCNGKPIDIELQNIANSCSSAREENLRSLIRKHFQLATDVITILNSKLKLVEHTMLHAEIKTLLDNYFARFPSEIYEKDMLRGQSYQILESARNNVGMRLVNFDMIPSNIVDYKGKPKVIDWEFAGASTLGFLEPFRFAYYYIFKLIELGILKCDDFCGLFDSLLSGNHWLSPLVLDFLHKNLQAWHLNSRLLSSENKADVLRAFFGAFFAYEAVLQYETMFFPSPEAIERLKLLLGSSNRYSKLRNDLVSYKNETDEAKATIEQLQAKLYYFNALIKILTKLHLKKPIKILIKALPRRLKDWSKARLNLHV